MARTFVFFWILVFFRIVGLSGLLICRGSWVGQVVKTFGSSGNLACQDGPVANTFGSSEHFVCLEFGRGRSSRHLIRQKIRLARTGG